MENSEQPVSFEISSENGLQVEEIKKENEIDQEVSKINKGTINSGRGIQYLEIEGYDPKDTTIKMLDLPSTVWNAIAEFYAHYHIGLEIRYCLPVPDRELPAIMDSPAGIFVIDHYVIPNMTSSEKREYKRLNNGRDLVHDLVGTVYDANRVNKNVRMRWVPNEMAWRDVERMKPFENSEPAVFMEALPGNIKLAANLDIDAVARGDIPIPPLFEWDRDDAPKKGKRIWVLPRPGATLIKVGETLLDTSSLKDMKKK